MSVLKTKKLPIVYEAMQFTGTVENILEMQIWCQYQVERAEYSSALRVHCLEAVALIKIGDYVVKGIKGEVWPVRQDIFEETYEIIKGE